VFLNRNRRAPVKLVTFTTQARPPQLGVLQGTAVDPIDGKRDVLDAIGTSPAELQRAASAATITSTARRLTPPGARKALTSIRRS
jgi:hypothetical protein